MNWGDARLPERFWDKVSPEPNSGCWLWTAYATPLGYGKFGVTRKAGMSLAHRHAYEVLVGEIPKGLVLDHLCRTPCCVNPAHLEPVTIAENTRRSPIIKNNGQLQRERTHCPKGHPYAGDNLFIRACGRRRECRECQRRVSRDYQRSKRAASKGGRCE